jgi:hypothetical protein
MDPEIINEPGIPNQPDLPEHGDFQIPSAGSPPPDTVVW